MKEVCVRVPATTANLGPGFDSLGVALGMFNTVRVQRDRISPPGAMAASAAKLFFKAASCRPFRFSWEVEGHVPRSRGLGSSVTVRLGLLHALNTLSGSPLDRDTIYRLCAKLEGHPDNAAPAEFGGFCVARSSGDFQRFALSPSLRFVMLIPDQEARTDDARALLPRSVQLRDAAENLAGSAFIAAALASKNYAALRGQFGDRLHQPYRKKIVPLLEKIISAAESAGALGGWLSGAGSTIGALTLDDPEGVAAAMRAAGGRMATRVEILKPDNAGTRVIATR